MAQYIGKRTTVDGYDADSEASRLVLKDVVVRSRRLNRGTAEVKVVEPDAGAESSARKRFDERLLPTTHDAAAPVVELDWPIHGPFVASPHGVYFDAYHGVAQRLLDLHHPRFVRMLEDLQDEGLLLRREIATDDVLVTESNGAAKTPADLGEIWDRAMRERWPHPVGYRAFLSSSGAEAIEAALKVCHQVAYKRFLERFGMETFLRVQAELGAKEVDYFRGEPSLPEHPVFDDYPFQIVACEGAFHGRTLGALALTWSKKAHQLSYPKPWNVHHVPYNSPGDPVRERVDTRGIAEILSTPGELRRVLREQRRIPKDLFAGFFAEPFQGEGGFLPGDAGFFARVRKVCDETGALLVADEVQSIGRTARLFAMEHLGVRPDIVCTAKSMVVGITIVPADFAKYMHGGWHSNTWGGGRVLDTTYGWTTLDVLLNHRDPAFDGLSYLENEEVKGRRLAAGLDRLHERHPAVLVGHRGLGLLRAVLVRRRADVIRTAWRHGLKLLGCGWAGDVAPIRLIFLADTLAREVDEFLDVFDRVLSAVER